MVPCTTSNSNLIIFASSTVHRQCIVYSYNLRFIVSRSLVSDWLFATPKYCSLSGSFVHVISGKNFDFPGKNIGVDGHFLLSEIFLTQGSNPDLLLCRQILYHWATREAPAYSWCLINIWLSRCSCFLKNCI